MKKLISVFSVFLSLTLLCGSLTLAAPSAQALTHEALSKPTTSTVPEYTVTLLGSFILAEDEIVFISGRIASKSNIYLVTIADGSNTYYIAVNLQTAEALALANPAVLRAVCANLFKRQTALAGDSPMKLMSYEHLVGELKMHFLAYLLTAALGGDSGPFARFYNSAKVADLNIDEDRGTFLIKILGTIYS